MIPLLAVVGVGLVVFGGFVLVIFPDRLGGDVRIFGMQVSSPAAGLPLIALGVAALVMAVNVERGGQPGEGGGGDKGARGGVLRIYSSLPQRVRGGSKGSNARTVDMENAIKLALKQKRREGLKFDVRYDALDATDEDGEPSVQEVADNARRAVKDGAVYIGDQSSTLSIVSIPILSEAGVPQISPASTRVGLTVGDPTGDGDEPDKYYANGARNFVRIIPNDNVQAAALVALMLKDGCKRVAMIYDGQDYSDGLSSTMALLERPARVIRQPIRPKATRMSGSLVRTARRRGADCFQYSGDNNPNTFGIFEAFAKALPDDALLYGTDGLNEVSFKDPDADGELAPFAHRVRLMVPPRDADRYRTFLSEMAEEYPRRYPGNRQDPCAINVDPYAAYAYEAMMLALDAIGRTEHGTRSEILKALKATKHRRDSVLGDYAIHRVTGDTNLVDYGVSRVSEGGLSCPERAVSRQRLGTVTRVLRARGTSASVKIAPTP